MLLNSPYTQHRKLETRTRTMLDLIFLDRLHKLQDQDALYRLRLSPEVSISAEIRDTDRGVEIIRGRADWALNYDTTTRPGSTLIVIEAKKVGNSFVGLPQLLVYMVGVLKSRHDRINQSVFGILSDSSNFLFAFLDHNKKFYVSATYRWALKQSEILAYIDTIFLDAIESSPHTTPTKKGNTTLMNYQQYLERRWVFGDGSDNKAEEAIKKESIVDVINGEKHMVVRTERHKEADEESNSETAGA
jgi:hypothetical protein